MMRLAYPAPPQGTHKGMPLRGGSSSGMGVNEYPFLFVRG